MCKLVFILFQYMQLAYIWKYILAEVRSYFQKAKSAVSLVCVVTGAYLNGAPVGAYEHCGDCNQNTCLYSWVPVIPIL